MTFGFLDSSWAGCSTSRSLLDMLLLVMEGFWELAYNRDPASEQLPHLSYLSLGPVLRSKVDGTQALKKRSQRGPHCHWHHRLLPGREWLEILMLASNYFMARAVTKLHVSNIFSTDSRTAEPHPYMLGARYTLKRSSRNPAYFVAVSLKPSQKAISESPRPEN